MYAKVVFNKVINCNQNFEFWMTTKVGHYTCLGLKKKQEDFRAARCAGDKGTFDSVLNLEYFLETVKFPRPTEK
jgi:hypothetical protein